MEKFHNAQGYVEVAVALDHCPIILNLDASKKKKRWEFKFETKWFMDQDCDNIVKEAWHKSTEGARRFHAQRKLKSTGVSLKKWSSSKFSNTKKEIDLLLKRLADIQSKS
ncbi:hypothetical protein REPUB_Repub20aG0065700 [Reevesia pubescens]